MPVSMTGKIAYVEVITPPAIRGPAGPRYFCLAGEAIETRPIGVAPENPPAPISYRLARLAQRVVFGGGALLRDLPRFGGILISGCDRRGAGSLPNQYNLAVLQFPSSDKMAGIARTIGRLTNWCESAVGTLGDIGKAYLRPSAFFFRSEERR